MNLSVVLVFLATISAQASRHSALRKARATWSKQERALTDGFVNSDLQKAVITETADFWSKVLPITMSLTSGAPSVTPESKPTASPISPPSFSPVTPEPTQAPIDPTSAPVFPTLAPAMLTPAPVVPTFAPAVPTPAPVVTTSAPVVPTSYPVATTVTPVTFAPVTLVPTTKPPTMTPTTPVPSIAESMSPTETQQPSTSFPTFAPTSIPSATPSRSLPSASPSKEPTSFPTIFPSTAPTFTCNLSPQDRESRIMALLTNGISDSEELNTPGSPQNLAASWLIDSDLAYACPDDPDLVQRYVMAVFYYSTEGDDWARCSAPSDFEDSVIIDEANRNCDLSLGGNAWLTPSSECTWAGLDCEDDVMVRIDFERNQMAGTIPSELLQLTALRYLLLEEGLITGTIPSEIGSLSALESIDLNFNLLRGSLPESIYTLSNLRQLDINDNEFTGSLPSIISGLEMLSFFQVENNLFTGTIPVQMGELQLLEVATMHSNSFSGSMPSLVCQNTSGLLVVLTADCLGAPSRPSPSYVACPCCTQCF